jgi:hypothetical protein
MNVVYGMEVNERGITKSDDVQKECGAERSVQGPES